ncbi:alginate export family protein [Flavobacterium eburneipallidum]|uniref:alginate export family protein n=1 Tax=Flavobacterium eburneipallidum TaxID=3003263 RepID=UPI0022ABDDDB|nr:alginate export family protein [Flavobacterium eburneipallidum]
MKITKSIYLPLLGLITGNVLAQDFKADIQIRPRFEYTNGFGTLITPTTEHTSFIGNRSRVNLNYGDNKLTVKLSLQNISTWGDVNTTPLASKNGVAAFEAYAEYKFTEKWSTKLGRQTLSYDNQRIIGGLDWATQGRSFDAALIKYKGAKSQLDLGFALNANSEAKVAAATPYATDIFKDMQYAWYHSNIKKLNFSLLAINVGREYLKTPTEIGLNYFQTFGTYAKYDGKKLGIDYSLYGQTGKIGKNTVSAWEAAVNLGYAFTPKFKATLGYEFLSGKDQNSTSTVVKSFAPLFGTNHAFNGFMDYFYVGNHANSVGLSDITLKLDFPIKKVNLSVAPHIFSAPNKIVSAGVEQDSYLGTEIDVTAVYKAYKDITLIAGYSQMFASDSMVALKGGTGLNDSTNNWAYLMININPQVFSTKK